VSLAGFTPGLPDVLGVPVQPSNFEPPGVTFAVGAADALVFEVAELFDCVLFEEFDCELSSAFFACPLFSAGAEVEAVALAELWSFAA